MIDGAAIKAVLGTVLGLPLAAMLVGLLAALLPVDWRHWVVLMLVLMVVFWSALIVIAGRGRRVVGVVLGLVAANGLAWLLLQTTSLYGSH